MQKKWKILILIAVGFAVFLIALPELLRLSAKHWGSEYLGARLDVEDINLNLFSGKLGVEGVTVDGEHGARFALGSATVDLNWPATLTRHWTIDSINISGLNARLVETPEGQWFIPVSTSVFKSDEPTEPDSEESQQTRFTLASLTIEKSNIEIAAQQVSGRLTVNEARVNLLTSATDDPANIVLDARWNDTPITVNTDVGAFQETQTLAGQFNLTKVSLKQFQPFLPEPLNGLDGSADIAISLKAKLGAEKLLSAKTTLNISGFSLNYGHLASQFNRVALQSDIKLDQHNADLVYNITGGAEISGGSIIDTTQNWTLAELSALSIEKAQASSDGYAELGNINLSGLRGLSLEPPQTEKDDETVAEQSHLVGIERMGIDSLKVTGGDELTLGNVAIASVNADVRLDEQGRVSGVKNLQDSLARFSSNTAGSDDDEPVPTENKPGSTTDEKSSFHYSLAALSLTGGDLTFTDNQHSPAAKLSAKLKAIEVGALSSLSPASATPISFAASVGEFGTVDFAGDIAPLGTALNLNIKGEAKGLSLHSVSPYMESLLAYELTAGQYDHKFDIEITDDEIDAENRLVIRKIKVKAKPDAKTEKTIDVPLEFSLNLLRDKNDNVKLNLPITGNLNDPKFSINDVIGTALRKALSTGSVATLKLALQPYGAIWMAAEAAGKGLSKSGVKFSPIQFDPMSAMPGSDSLAYIEKVGALLDDRPKIELRLCGIANRADAENYRQQIVSAQNTEILTPEQETDIANADRYLALAEERAVTVKRLLVDNHGIDAARLYICKPQYQSDGELSGVEVGF